MGGDATGVVECRRAGGCPARPGVRPRGRGPGRDPAPGRGHPPPNTLEGLLYALPRYRCLVDARRPAAALGDAPPVPRTSPWFGHAPLAPAHLAGGDGAVFGKDMRPPRLGAGRPCAGGDPMSAPLTVTHTHGERISVACGGVELMAYVHRPDPDAFESRKPYAHPLRTLAGRTVTGHRPSDHRWHKGLQMTASHLSGRNFRGGDSCVHGRGYPPLRDRVGWMRHDGFDAVEVLGPEGDRVRTAERLTWIENGGRERARETHTVEVHSAEPEEGAWALDWSVHLTNIRAEPLVFGSPTTAGREMAGCTGLHWRGPRDFTGGDVLGPGGRGGKG